jgi:hypothetical protein
MMQIVTQGAVVGAVVIASLGITTPADAQLGGFGRKIKERVQAAGSGQQAGTPAASAAASRPAGSGGPGVWANYDFIPGYRTLYYTDFTDDGVGDFPRRLEFKTGSMEVVELDGHRALKASSSSGFVVPLPEVLPARFTIEIDVINRNDRSTAAPTVKIYGGTAARTDVDVERTRLAFGNTGWDVSGGGTKTEAQFTSEEADAWMGRQTSVRILGDGNYLKLYADGRRLANVPNGQFMRGRGIFVALEGRDGETGAVYVTRIRVAESERPVYEALAAAGRWATQGIFFDVGKSSIRPESTPALKAIARALEEHPDLRLLIEGHTDNVGDAAANLALSRARAEAVKAALVESLGIAAARLETAGLGDTKPAADNESPEGRSSNRRVEVVKL